MTRRELKNSLMDENWSMTLIIKNEAHDFDICQNFGIIDYFFFFKANKFT